MWEQLQTSAQRQEKEMERNMKADSKRIHLFECSRKKDDHSLGQSLQSTELKARKVPQLSQKQDQQPQLCQKQDQQPSQTPKQDQQLSQTQKQEQHPREQQLDH